MRLWEVIEYFHTSRLTRIEAEENLDEFLNENIKSQYVKDECNKIQEATKEDTNNKQENTTETNEFINKRRQCNVTDQRFSTFLVP